MEYGLGLGWAWVRLWSWYVPMPAPASCADGLSCPRRRPVRPVRYVLPVLSCPSCPVCPTCPTCSVCPVRSIRTVCPVCPVRPAPTPWFPGTPTRPGPSLQGGDREPPHASSTRTDGRNERLPRTGPVTWVPSAGPIGWRGLEGIRGDHDHERSPLWRVGFAITSELRRWWWRSRSRARSATATHTLSPITGVGGDLCRHPPLYIRACQ